MSYYEEALGVPTDFILEKVRNPNEAMLMLEARRAGAEFDLLTEFSPFFAVCCHEDVLVGI
jgi:hypothetical protein